VVGALVLLQSHSHRAKEDQRRHNPDEQARAREHMVEHENQKAEIAPRKNRAASESAHASAFGKRRLFGQPLGPAESPAIQISTDAPLQNCACDLSACQIALRRLSPGTRGPRPQHLTGSRPSGQGIEPSLRFDGRVSTGAG